MQTASLVSSGKKSKNGKFTYMMMIKFHVNVENDHG